MDWFDALKSIGAFASPFLFFGGTYLGLKFTRRTDKESNLTEHWDKYGQRMEALHQKQQAWMEEKLAERDTRIDALSAESQRQSSEIRQLSEKVEAVRVKYRSALGHIGRIRVQLAKYIHPDHIEPIPSEIEPDM